jgi:hypothetical protein
MGIQRRTLEQFLSVCTVRRVNERGNTIHETFTMAEAHTVDRLLPVEFFEQEGWRDSWFRVVWTAPELLTIATFCEGDLTFDVCPDEDHFWVEVTYIADCYRASYKSRQEVLSWA